MAGEVARRPKASVQKVRTGCKTCKIRRVKCDEQKPSCLRCTSTGRKCDGYDPAFTRRMNRLPLADACPNPSAAATRVIYKIPFKIPGSQSDRQLLHYFCVQAAGELEGYSTSDFWTHQLLQQSHREPIIRRALIAVASIHQEYIVKGPRGSKGDKINPLTLIEYNKAVRQLRKYLASTTNPCRTVILVCCVLFYCFETAREEYEAAMEHLRAGLTILKGWIEEKGIPYSASDQTCSSDIGLLMQTFARMDLQASIFDDSRLPFLCLASPDERAGRASCVPLDFTRLSEVQITFDKLQSWLFHFLVSNLDYKFTPVEEVPDSVIREKAELEKQFSRWSSALNAFVKSNRFTRSQSTERSVKLLVLLHRGLCILTRAGLLTPDPGARNYDADFNIIVTLAEEISSCPNQEVKEDRRSFTFETGVVAPLSLIIAKCRDPELRKRALSLLAISPRREGLIDGELVIRIAERLIEFEASDAPPQVSHGERSLEESVSAAAAMEATPGFDKLAETLWLQDKETSGTASAASGTPCALPGLSSARLWDKGWEGSACLGHMNGVSEHNPDFAILGTPVPGLGIPSGTGFGNDLGAMHLQVNSTKRS